MYTMCITMHNFVVFIFFINNLYYIIQVLLHSCMIINLFIYYNKYIIV